MRRAGDVPAEGVPSRTQAELDREHRQLQRARQARIAKLLVALFLAVVLVIFIVANSKRVPIDYVFVESEARLIWIMLFCSVVGGIVGFLIGRPGRQVRFRRRERPAPGGGETKRG